MAFVVLFTINICLHNLKSEFLLALFTNRSPNWGLFSIIKTHLNWAQNQDSSVLFYLNLKSYNSELTMRLVNRALLGGPDQIQGHGNNNKGMGKTTNNNEHILQLIHRSLLCNRRYFSGLCVLTYFMLWGGLYLYSCFLNEENQLE